MQHGNLQPCLAYEQYTGYLKKSVTVIIQMLLRGDGYENLYT
jgi:hypothetical protein